MSASDTPTPQTRTNRIPFMLRVYEDVDHGCRQHDVGPFWVDVPEDEIAASIPADMPGGHWEHICQIEKFARDRIAADLECSIAVDAIGKTPDAYRDAAQRELAAARADSERLDWLENARYAVEVGPLLNWQKCYDKESLRAAIDAARKDAK